MRLINANTLQIEDFTLKEKPPYAILSHTWGTNEISFQHFCSGHALSGEGYNKIVTSCRLALERELSYLWIDTCCIDKTNSTELSEAINSMFRWYGDSTVCFAYLSDLTTDTADGFFGCRWWTRGWTLQEFIAPSELIFYNQRWDSVGDKRLWSAKIKSRIGLPIIETLAALSKYSVAERMSWAANRSTTRLEDEAYCLLGIFDVNIPLIYGEGRNAFRRLQQEIIQKSNDLSILQFDNEAQTPSRLLATEPRQFTPQMAKIRKSQSLAEFTLTNRGLLITEPRLFFLYNVDRLFSDNIDMFLNNMVIPYSLSYVVDLCRLSLSASLLRGSIPTYVLELDADTEAYLPLVKAGAATFMRHPDFEGDIVYSDLPRMYHYNRMGLELNVVRQYCKPEELGKLFVLLDQPNYKLANLFKFYVDFKQIISSAPTSAFDQADSSMIMGVATDHRLTDRVLAFRWKPSRSEATVVGKDGTVVLFLYIEDPIFKTLSFYFCFDDYKEGPMDFLFGESCREKSVSVERLREKAPSVETTPRNCIHGRIIRSILGEPVTKFHVDATCASDVYYEYSLLSGNWLLSLCTEVGQCGRVTSVRCSVNELNRPAINGVCHMKLDGRMVQSSSAQKCDCQ